ncbi:MAG: hypothetical protein QF918_05315 [Pirellulaceae bacterium]|jgi:hypothetical protein|nr:hypothetical protein [Planctomycetaceae bacterium]MDP6467132.1 hypothetical protein [Pirellulaceae bacterium]MDP6555258.1 hypothetical protein [Pirellulaceae bacterium]MDP6719643.1 hypothetical protein [Pirellulaceae bacterium]
MTGLKTRLRGTVVVLAATICICVGSAVFSYHFGYLQGTRETIKNSSTDPIPPDHFAPMPTEDPIEIRWDLLRNATNELEFNGTA